MDPVVIGYSAALALIVSLAIGIPIGIAMGAVGVGGMLLSVGPALTFGQLRTLPFAVVNNYDFAVLPLFVLMGVLAETSGITGQVFYAADLWLRRLRGGRAGHREQERHRPQDVPICHQSVLPARPRWSAWPSSGPQTDEAGKYLSIPPLGAARSAVKPCESW